MRESEKKTNEYKMIESEMRASVQNYHSGRSCQSMRMLYVEQCKRLMKGGGKQDSLVKRVRKTFQNNGFLFCCLFDRRNHWGEGHPLRQSKPCILYEASDRAAKWKKATSGSSNAIYDSFKRALWGKHASLRRPEPFQVHSKLSLPQRLVLETPVAVTDTVRSYHVNVIRAECGSCA